MSCDCKKNIFIGGLFPLTVYPNNVQRWTGGRGILPAVQMAFEEINNGDTLRDYHLTLFPNDTKVPFALLQASMHPIG